MRAIVLSLIVWVCAMAAVAWSGASAKREVAAAERAAPNLENGAMLYRHCVACHGGDASGESGGFTPRIAGQHQRVLIKQLVDFRHGKRWDVRMEQVTHRQLFDSTQNIADLATYVSRLPRLGPRGFGDGLNVSEGARIYRTRCQKCHGMNAQGDDAKRIPMLAGQHYAYLLRQMYDAADGRRPTMLPAHSKSVAPLDFDEVKAVADFLARLESAS